MAKVMEFVKNHFVEVIGFITILLLILLISYLKIFKKTFTCELTEKDGSATIYQRYIIKQSNNKLKNINYYYKAKAPGRKENKQLSEFYKSLINNKDALHENNVELKFKNDELILKYDLNLDNVKNNDVYKNARSFVKSVKSMGYKCK